MSENTVYSIFISGAVVVLVCLVFLGMWGCPRYEVWQQGLKGEAELARAQQNRQIVALDGEMALKKAEHSKKILIEQAKAELEASKIRSEAIEIMGALAKQYPEYREQEFIGAFAEAVQDGSIHQIIYVPTESNIPIVEAGRALGK